MNCTKIVWNLYNDDHAYEKLTKICFFMNNSEIQSLIKKCIDVQKSHNIPLCHSFRLFIHENNGFDTD